MLFDFLLVFASFVQFFLTPLQAKSFRTSFLVQTNSVCLHPAHPVALPRLQPLSHTFSLPCQHLPDPLPNLSPILLFQIFSSVLVYCIFIRLSRSNPINRVLAFRKASYFPKFFFQAPNSAPCNPSSLTPQRMKQATTLFLYSLIPLYQLTDLGTVLAHPGNKEPFSQHKGEENM